MEYQPNLIGARIRKRRKELALTQERLAEQVDMSPMYLGQIENGRRGVNLFNIIALANALSVTLDYLVSDFTSEPIAQSATSEAEWLALFRCRTPRERELLLNLVKDMSKTLFSASEDSNI